MRLEGDEEYLQQCVLRDKISAEPHKKHWGVQEKAIAVARRLGKLETIHAWYATLLANTMRARAESDLQPYSCPAAAAPKGNFDHLVLLILGIVFICGAILGALMFHFCCTKRNRAPPINAPPEKRSVGVQSQTTYTSLRGVIQPRFHPLPEDSHGAFH